MLCLAPLSAQVNGWTKNFKTKYIFKNNPKYNKGREPDKLFCCRQCMPCRIAKSGEWAVRLMHQAQMHEHNIFLTLTQNPENMPVDRGLDHRQIQLFMKRLRQHYSPELLSYFCGAEYGKQKINPHWHLIIFNIEVADLILHTKNKRGDKLYTSDTIEKIWGRGFITIGEVNKTTCAYTAGYLMKDSTMNHQAAVDLVDIETGELYTRKKPYNSMSTRPAIGKEWYEKYPMDVFPHDYCVVKGKKINTPSYYRRQLEKSDPILFEELRELRNKAMDTEQFKFNNTPERIKVRAKCQELNIKSQQLERQL